MILMQERATPRRCNTNILKRSRRGRNLRDWIYIEHICLWVWVLYVILYFEPLTDRNENFFKLQQNRVSSHESSFRFIRFFLTIFLTLISEFIIKNILLIWLILTWQWSPYYVWVVRASKSASSAILRPAFADTFTSNPAHKIPSSSCFHNGGANTAL